MYQSHFLSQQAESEGHGPESKAKNKGRGKIAANRRGDAAAAIQASSSGEEVVVRRTESVVGALQRDMIATGEEIRSLRVEFGQAKDAVR